MILPVKVSNSDNLPSYIVIESVHWAGIDETVSYPESCFDSLLDLTLDLDIYKSQIKMINVKMPSSFKIEQKGWGYDIEKYKQGSVI